MSESHPVPSEPVDVATVIAKAFDKISEMLTVQATAYTDIATALRSAQSGGSSMDKVLSALDAVGTHSTKKKHAKPSKDHPKYDVLVLCTGLFCDVV